MVDGGMALWLSSLSPEWRTLPQRSASYRDVSGGGPPPRRSALYTDSQHALPRETSYASRNLFYISRQSGTRRLGTSSCASVTKTCCHATSQRRTWLPRLPKPVLQNSSVTMHCSACLIRCFADFVSKETTQSHERRHAQTQFRYASSGPPMCLKHGPHFGGQMWTQNCANNVGTHCGCPHSSS